MRTGMVQAIHGRARAWFLSIQRESENALRLVALPIPVHDASLFAKERDIADGNDKRKAQNLIECGA